LKIPISDLLFYRYLVAR